MREVRVMSIPRPLRPGPWLVERIQIALMVGGLLATLLVVAVNL